MFFYFAIAIPLFIASCNAQCDFKCYQRTVTTSFTFYDSNSKNGETVSRRDLEDFDFDDFWQIKFLIHDTTGNKNDFKDLIREYVREDDVGVILVDYKLENNPENELRQRRVVYLSIANIIYDIVENSALSYDDIHIIGHGMGGIIGMGTGLTIHSMTGKKVGRVTNLDPIKYKQLPESAAKFTDTIYTSNAQDENVANISFYPNGGKQQPGCSTNDQECSHKIVIKYFTDSISDETYVATVCSSFDDFTAGFCDDFLETDMGEYVDKKMTGKFMLRIATR